LALNDALVDLAGALAGLTLALQNSCLIGLAGLITGNAAPLSLSTSEYQSRKLENESKVPIFAAFYTGIANSWQ
jgi:VIT1/CCC1 family predicted Fe2+/Mn2+ transporter